MQKMFGILVVCGGFVGACKKEVAPTPPVVVPDVVESVVQAEELADEEVARLLIENFQRVYFDYDSSELGEDAKEALGHNAELLNRHRGIRVRIQGHADERGTTEYNLHLGQRRAQRALDYMVNRGVSPERVQIISYGEEIPLEKAEGEIAFSKNRRAEFELLLNSETIRGTVN